MSQPPAAGPCGAADGRREAREGFHRASATRVTARAAAGGEEAAVIECDECGANFEPMTDTYQCPECGAHCYPDKDDDQ